MPDNKNNKTKFKFKITYFKESGKYYHDIEVEWEIRHCIDQPNIAYMLDACAKIRGLRDSGGPDALPGLAGSNWEGYILVDCEQGYPCLIKPNQQDTTDP